MMRKFIICLRIKKPLRKKNLTKRKKKLKRRKKLLIKKIRMKMKAFYQQTNNLKK
jgi:hypothetical protein